MKKYNKFMSSKLGSILNVAIYIVVSNLVIILADYFGALNVKGDSLTVQLAVGVINTILVIGKQYFKK